MSLEQAIQENTRAIAELTQILRAQMAQAPAEPAAPVPAPIPEVAPSQTPEPLPAELFDADTVRDAFIAFARTHGRAGQLEALAAFGVAKLGELPESEFGNMISYLGSYGASNG